jgi:hypothetical protein
MTPRKSELTEVAQLQAALAQEQRLNADLKAAIRELQEGVREMAWARVEPPDVNPPLRLHLVAE